MVGTETLRNIERDRVGSPVGSMFQPLWEGWKDQA